MTEHSKNTTTGTIEDSHVSLTRRLRRMKRRLLFEHVLENDEAQDIADTNIEEEDEQITDTNIEEEEDEQITSSSTPMTTERATTTGSRRREKLRNILTIHRVDKRFLRDTASSNRFQMARQRD